MQLPIIGELPESGLQCDDQKLQDLTSSKNTLLASDKPVHQWYRFVLAYPPHLVRRYLKRFGVTAERLSGPVLDPFCGTGTTIVECKKLGIDSYGVDAHPLSVFVSTAKTTWDTDPEEFKVHCKQIAGTAEADLGMEGTRKQRTLPDDQQELLPHGIINPTSLDHVLTLREYIWNAADQRFRLWQELALATVVVKYAANVHFGPEIGLSKEKAGRTGPPSVVQPWLKMCNLMADDLDLVKRSAREPGNAKIIRGDARDCSNCGIARQSIPFVVTSPPYPNEKDYTRTVRLESIILELLGDRKQLREIKNGLLRSNTRNVFVEDQDGSSILKIQEIVDLAERIDARRLELCKSSGFEKLYGSVIRQYFGGMHRHLSSLRTVLKPGARCAYVVGDQSSFFRIKVPTAHLLSLVAKSLDYEVESIEPFRTRRSTTTGELLSERVLVLRLPG